MTAEPTSQQSQQSNIVGRLLRTKVTFTLNDRPSNLNLISVSLLTELQTVTKGSAVLVLQYCDMGGYAHIRVLTAAGEVGWIPAYAEDYCVVI